MAPIVHIIDPHPDAVIVLRNPCTIFAPWGPEEEKQKPVVPEVPAQPDGYDSWGSTGVLSKKMKKMKKSKRRVERKAQLCLTVYLVLTQYSMYASVPLLTSASFEPAAESSTYDLKDGSTASAEASSARKRTPSPIAPNEPAEPEEESIHYHVSSRHLMLASPIFKRALTQNGFAESVPNEINGLYYIEAHDWDAEAFLIVLRIVHGRNKQVPREVTLEMLAKIAVLEDYYNFGEALEIFTEVWIQRLTKASTPSKYCRDLVLWVWVAWVFDVEHRFSKTTATAISHSTEAFRTLDLPIPAIVSGEIDSKRYQAIEYIVEELHQRLETYRRTDYACPYGSHESFQCGSFLLGSMTKELSRLGLYQPRPEVPFPDLSFTTLCGEVQGMASPSWFPRGTYNAHPCNLNAAMATLIEDVSNAVGGLNLSDLKERRSK